MGDDRPTRSASMGDPSAKCHNDDKKEKERKCEEGKEMGTVRTCIRDLIDSIRTHCRTSALRGKAVALKRGEDRPRLFLLHESVVYWIDANISFTWEVFSFFSAFASI
jgi:hypothetical protein